MRQYFKIRLLFLLSIGYACSSPAQLAGKYPGYSEGTYQGIRYGLFKPANYTPRQSFPLVVYLHGSNDTISRELLLYQDSIQKKFRCFVLTPKCTVSDQGWGNTWQPAHSAATAATLALTDSIIQQYSIDTTRLYLYGISMGAFGVFAILQKNPGLFTAAYAVCGGSDVKAAPVVMRTPLWIFHGADDDIVPLRLSQNIYQEIIRLGGTKTKFTVYPGVKHNSWENAGKEPALLPWLFAQRKK